jgi:hypothetical protein
VLCAGLTEIGSAPRARVVIDGIVAARGSRTPARAADLQRREDGNTRSLPSLPENTGAPPSTSSMSGSARLTPPDREASVRAEQADPPLVLSLAELIGFTRRCMANRDVLK